MNKYWREGFSARLSGEPFHYGSAVYKLSARESWEQGWKMGSKFYKLMCYANLTLLFLLFYFIVRVVFYIL